jgi:ribulose-5-phosphate 4-epimerase/fuculose-1-phosphate aldolase
MPPVSHSLIQSCDFLDHGSLTLGTTIDKAIYLFTALENACRVQLMAEAAAANGIQKVLIDEEDAAFSAATLADPKML